MSLFTKDLASQINLRKEIVVDLTKKLNIADFKANVVVACDFSGSMSDEFRDGLVQRVMERLLPIALTFDNDGSIDMFLFHQDYIQLPVPVTMATIKDYVKNHIIGKYSMGWTNYAPVLNAIRDFVKGSKTVTTSTQVQVAAPEKKGFFGKLFGGGSTTETVTSTSTVAIPTNIDKSVPTFIIFITDGDNGDKTQTTQTVKDMSAEPIFIQFVGLSNGNGDFPYLQKLDDLSGRVVDNADFFSVKDLDKMSDQDLYKELLKEIPSWQAAARAKNIIA